jgi:hypothetical protein
LIHKLTADGFLAGYLDEHETQVPPSGVEVLGCVGRNGKIPGYETFLESKGRGLQVIDPEFDAGRNQEATGVRWVLVLDCVGCNKLKSEMG